MAESTLDALAAEVFEGEAGRQRLQPLLQRFQHEVGRIGEDDPNALLWQAIRLDWALCEVELGGPGDTWAARAAAGLVPGISPREELWPIARATVGLFELEPDAAGSLWLRDRLSGLIAPLCTPFAVPRTTDMGLWELRVVLAPEGLLACRMPLVYPQAIVPLLDKLHARRFAGEPLRLQALRRAHLQWSRQPRADALAVFRSALRL